MYLEQSSLESALPYPAITASLGLGVKAAWGLIYHKWKCPTTLLRGTAGAIEQIDTFINHSIHSDESKSIRTRIAEFEA